MKWYLALSALLATSVSQAGSVLPDQTRSQYQMSGKSTGIIWNTNKFLRSSFALESSEADISDTGFTSDQYIFSADGIYSADNLTTYTKFTMTKTHNKKDGNTDSKYEYVNSNIAVGYKITSKVGFSLSNYTYTLQSKTGGSYEHKSILDAGLSYRFSDRIVGIGGTEQVQWDNQDSLRPYFGLGYTTYKDDKRNGGQVELIASGSNKIDTYTETQRAEKEIKLQGSLTHNEIEFGYSGKYGKTSDFNTSSGTKTYWAHGHLEYEVQRGSLTGLYGFAKYTHTINTTRSELRTTRKDGGIGAGYRQSNFEYEILFSKSSYNREPADSSLSYTNKTLQGQAELRYNF
ncbi:MAG: hypothetical protein KAG61_07930 [Bacteriovoracaceae bacterium]|nr:hypothetical protein [Bacteriovoracaceae bacterium]